MEIIGLFVIVLFLWAISRSIAQWSYNNSQPVLTVDAQLVAKRTNISRGMNSMPENSATSTVSTTYYATFQLASGERLEFLVRGNEFGMLAEGDIGQLTFQGTRYKGFERLNSSIGILN